MARPFVVVGKAGTAVSDLDCRFIKFDEKCRRGILPRIIGKAAGSRFYFTKNRMKRILRKDMFDVCDEQLLMLLLVMKAKRHDRLDFIEKFFVGVGKEIVDVGVNRGAKAIRLFHGRPRDQAAQIATVHVACGVVIRIKKICVFGNLGAISGHPFLDDKRFEKPGGMRKVPFGRADVGHRLHNAILRLEALAKSRGKIPDFVKTGEQLLGARQICERTRRRGHSLVDCRRRCWVQVIPPSCSSSSLRASTI